MCALCMVVYQFRVHLRLSPCLYFEWTLFSVLWRFLAWSVRISWDGFDAGRSWCSEALDASSWCIQQVVHALGIIWCVLTMGRWGHATLRTWRWGHNVEDTALRTQRWGHNFVDRRLWGHATLRTCDFEDKHFLRTNISYCLFSKLHVLKVMSSLSVLKFVFSKLHVLKVVSSTSLSSMSHGEEDGSWTRAEGDAC